MLRMLDAASEAHLAGARELLATLSRTLTEFGALATDQAGRPGLPSILKQLEAGRPSQESGLRHR